MPTTSRRTHKHFQLDAGKIRRARKVLRTKTETETIERALDAVIEESMRSRLVREANRRFFESGADIKDVFGRLDKD
jgi:hypothetical protein